MSDTFVNLGTVARASNYTSGIGGNIALRTDVFGNQGVNEVMGRYSQLAIDGALYVATDLAAAAGIAGVVAPPTTTSGKVLYNAAAAASKTVLFPLWIGVAAKSGTIGSGLTVQVGLAQGVLATPLTANGTSMTCRSLLDGLTVDSTSFSDINKTIVQASYVNFSAGGAAVGIGSGLSIDVGGLFVVRPQNVLDVSVLGPTGTSPVYFVSIVYAKLQVDLASAQ